MGLTIEDGKGRGNIAEVTNKNGLRVYAENIEEVALISGENQLTFSLTSTYAAGANDKIIYMKNNDPERNFIIRYVTVGSTVATMWQLFSSLTGTPAGTAIIPVNTNIGSGKVAFMTALGNAAVTGTTPAHVVANAYTSAYSTYSIDFLSGLIIQYGSELILATSEAGTVVVTIIGYFK
jgi:hypothetical protein